ncbi:MAG: small multi-drug export protein [Dehalococcoidia bacterium]
MTREIAWVLLATVSPISELRGGIPLGILKYELDPLLIFCIAVIANALLFFPIFFALRLFYVKLLSRIPFFDRYLANLRKRGEPKVERYGFWGLFSFVAVPLPITGAYTGTILAWLLGMDWKRAFPAVGLGVIVAGVVVLLITRLIQLGILSVPWIFPGWLN